MNNQRQKKTKSEVATLLGVAVVFLGLIVMLVGIVVAGDEEDIQSLATLLAGIGIFVGGVVMTCVAAVLTQRAGKKQTEQIKAALPENAVLIGGDTSAHFTEEGLRILRDSAFADFAPVIPYSELTVYCGIFRRSSRAKGKEAVFLALPAGVGEPDREEEEEGRDLYPVGEEVLPLAQKYGVKVVDHRYPPVKKPKFQKKFTHRFPEQRKIALRWTVISIVAFAAVLGVCLAIALNTEYNTSGLAGGLAAGVVTPCVLTAANNWKKNVLKIYEEGVFLSTVHGKSFLFWEEIERIQTGFGEIVFDCGGIGASFPEMEGAMEYLREIHPEKFEESVCESL